MNRLFLALALVACSSDAQPAAPVAHEPTSIEFRELRRLPTRARALVAQGDDLLIGAQGEVLRVVDGEIMERFERPAYRGGALVEASALVAWPTWSRGDEVRELGDAGTRLLASVGDSQEIFELRQIGETQVLRAYSTANPSDPRELARGPRLAAPLALSDAWVAVVAGSVRVLERESGTEVALLSSDRYALRALAFDGDELLGVDARGTLTRWRLDLPERVSEPSGVPDPRHLLVDGRTLVVVGAHEIWARREDREGRFAIEAGQIESALLLGDTLVIGVRGRPSEVRWLRLE